MVDKDNGAVTSRGGVKGGDELRIFLDSSKYLLTREPAESGD